MGLCESCCGYESESEKQSVITPDPETRRRQMAEAAEQRAATNRQRGIGNTAAVERQAAKDRAVAQASERPAGGDSLRWQMD